MATRMEIFIGLTFYLIIATVLTGLIGASLVTYKYSTISTSTINTSDDISSTTKTGLRSNALLLWDLMTLSYDTLGLPSVIIFFILVTIPSIIWMILLASFIIPTTNAGG